MDSFAFAFDNPAFSDRRLLISQPSDEPAARRRRIGDCASDALAIGCSSKRELNTPRQPVTA